ncbi:hypothetical protein AA14337_0275 [Acetobacter malorum DSM 14337]|uniref:Transposase n=1 Tax=Acetobacter malorum DSM 14337 TaxID=1307910 RepID=A0ABQ0PM32_9PROT|nr:hypothetical protein AA14337_0275 [Acetobacter malorum DSM 14337]
MEWNVRSFQGDGQAEFTVPDDFIPRHLFKREVENALHGGRLECGLRQSNKPGLQMWGYGA